MILSRAAHANALRYPGILGLSTLINYLVRDCQILILT